MESIPDVLNHFKLTEAASKPGGIVTFLERSTTLQETVYTEYTKNPTFYSIWEIQRRVPFQSSVCKLENYYRIKNVATGLYLSNDATQMIELTHKGSNKACFFKFIARENDHSKNGIISYTQHYKLQTISDAYIQIDQA